ncbi:bacteriohemerythrin [Azovibrio restrictus]|uniref:bacteriohemerythrin n=1 Tax=Azovibrio restrictus TaxID=146938 RepID=UPI0026ECEF42|nr:bacteriohemerythrin [Azovibrio restrictus]
MLNKNGIVHWSEEYSIGLETIDAQHMALIELVNDLWRAIASNAPVEVSQRLLERLEHYTVAHFGAEESMMRALQYPDFATHKLAHAKFVHRIQAERQHLLQGRNLSLDILHFLRDWLVNHILVSDKAYARFCAEKEQPMGFFSRLFSRLRGTDREALSA